MQALKGGERQECLPAVGQVTSSRQPRQRDESCRGQRRRGYGVSVGVEGHLGNHRATGGRHQRPSAVWASCSCDWSSNWQPKVLQSSPKKNLRQRFSAGGVARTTIFFTLTSQFNSIALKITPQNTSPHCHHVQ